MTQPPVPRVLSQSERDYEQNARALQLNVEAAWWTGKRAHDALAAANLAVTQAAPADLAAAQAAQQAAALLAQTTLAAYTLATNEQTWDTTVFPDVPPAAPITAYTPALRAAMRAGHSAKRTSQQATHPGQIWEPKGGLRDTPDDRDRLYFPPAHLTANLPPAVDLRPAMPPVYWQLGQSCASNAIAAAVQFLQQKAGQPAPEPAPQFLYYNARMLVGQEAQECGTATRDNIKAVVRFGLPAYELWRNASATVCVQPTPEIYQTALLDVVTSYSRIPIKLDHMKACLAEGFPFVVSLNRFKQSDKNDGSLTLPTEAELATTGDDGHTILIVGYSQPDQTFQFRNSWGSNWGDDGYGTMPFAYLQDPRLVEDCWTIRADSSKATATPEGSVPAGPPPTSPESSPPASRDAQAPVTGS